MDGRAEHPPAQEEEQEEHKEGGRASPEARAVGPACEDEGHQHGDPEAESYGHAGHYVTPSPAQWGEHPSGGSGLTPCGDGGKMTVLPLLAWAFLRSGDGGDHFPQGGPFAPLT